MKCNFVTWLAAGLAACCLVGCDVDVEDPGALPDVDVRGPDVDIQSEEREITIPDVDVDVHEEKAEVTVPDVDVTLPDENDADATDEEGI